MTATGNVSIPMHETAPRQLSEVERATLARIAETLIPAHGTIPAAAAEPGFWEQLSIALDARADAFDAIVDALGDLATERSDRLWDRLRELDEIQPDTFQALSAVIAGAWLLTPSVRNRIGYQGQKPDKAGLEEAADEMSSGILDPVLYRDPQEGPRWIR